MLQHEFETAQQILNTANAVNTVALTEKKLFHKGEKQEETEEEERARKQADTIKDIREIHNANQAYFGQHLGVYLYSLAAMIIAVGSIWVVKKIHILAFAARGHWVRDLYDETDKNIKEAKMNDAHFAKRL